MKKPMNEPSITEQLSKKVLQSEAIMHVMLDWIIDKQPMDFGGMNIPRSVAERLQDGLLSGKISGMMEIDD